MPSASLSKIQFGSKGSLMKTERAQKWCQSSRSFKLSGRQSFFRHFKGTSSWEECKPIFSDLILWNNDQFVLKTFPRRYNLVDFLYQSAAQKCHSTSIPTGKNFTALLHTKRSLLKYLLLRRWNGFYTLVMMSIQNSKKKLADKTVNPFSSTDTTFGHHLFLLDSFLAWKSLYLT